MFNKTEEFIKDIALGKMVILMDDESRENEGDIIFAAKFADIEKVNFLLNYAKGLICVPMDENRADFLGLRSMVEKNNDSYGTAFTVSVDASEGVTTGISAYDRARTIQVLGCPSSTKNDLSAPGHMFPLRAKKNGVLDRPGHTEAAVDLIRLSGIDPAVGVICEIINQDGTMARRDDLINFARLHNLKIGTIKELINYRIRVDKKVELKAKTRLPVEGLGEWEAFAFENLVTGKEHIAILKKELESNDPILVRIHSECFTGDVLGSERCDCRSQLRNAMEMINREGRGLIIYLRQEGRGIGLINKIKAYNLQDKGYDTVEANELLGFNADLRDYHEAADILKQLGYTEINLITNNPEKIDGLKQNGIKIKRRVSMPAHVHRNNQKYLKTKKLKFGHKLENLEFYQ